MVKGTEHGRVKWCEKTKRERGYENDNNKCATEAKVRERDFECVKVADLCGTKSPLQRHQPLKARPPQHSIDLRNKPILIKGKLNEGGVYTGGPTWLDLRWGPKGVFGERVREREKKSNDWEKKEMGRRRRRRRIRWIKW